MKKTLGSYFSRYFKMPSLYRDDLEALESIIRKELKPDAMHVALNGFEYDELSEVGDIAGPADTIVFYTHTPCIRLKFARSWAELYATDITEKNHAALTHMAELIPRTERRQLWLFAKLSTWIAPLFTFAALAIGPIFITLGWLELRPGFSATILLALLGMVWWVIGRHWTVSRFCKINVVTPREEALQTRTVTPTC